MRLLFTGLDSKVGDFKEMFVLSLEKGKILASNSEGEAFLRNLAALEGAGMGLKDSKLFVTGMYEELFQFFKEHYISPYLSAIEV